MYSSIWFEFRELGRGAGRNLLPGHTTDRVAVAFIVVTLGTNARAKLVQEVGVSAAVYIARPVAAKLTHIVL